MTPYPTHLLFDVSATLIYPFPSFEDYCVEFLKAKGVTVDESARQYANQAADNVLAMHKKKVSIIPNHPVSERIVWSHYQSVRLQHLSKEDKDHPWLEWGYEVYDSYNPSGQWRVYDDVHQTLEALKKAGFTLIVVSDFGPGLEHILELLDLKKYFEAFFVSTVEGVSKAHSQLYEMLLKQIKVDPTMAVMIGDNHEMDVEMAAALGISTIWLNREGKKLPTSHKEETRVIASLNELPSLLLSPLK
jgi:HAD superfamily hydrolase (TIGR01509 family)